MKITTCGNPVTDGELIFDQQVVSTTGVVCIPHRSLTLYAKKQLGNQATVCLAIEPNNLQSYLLVENGQPIHDTTVYEAMCYHIDFLKVARN